MSGHDESAPSGTGVHPPPMGAEGGGAAGGEGEPPRKRPRAADDLRRRLLEHKFARLRTLRDRFTEQLSELYFLQAGGNMTEYAAWRRRPASPALAAFVEARRPAAVSAPPAADPALDKAKQEAWVARRVAELARAGLWAERRLPRVLEPPRHKTHWDYLLEEMAWLAQDFAHERKWKKQAARKCARAIQKYFQDKAAAAQKAEKAQEIQLKKIASFAAKEIRTFWANVEKLVEWKRVRRVERARKEALDEQLSYMVDRSERYSRALAAGLAGAGAGAPSPPPSDYEPGDDSADDESTIAAEERRDRADHAAELRALQRDADLPLDDLVRLYSGEPNPADRSADASADDTTDCSDTDADSDDERASSPERAPLEQLVAAADGAQDGARDGEQDGEERVQAASSLAASLQPTGTTLAETAVGTPVPRLLRLPLREYQHVGLHWLATMHARQLNGILADEMGLGKTIQTIALLAHLALRGDWGPHLVVAPTSVVLNWEMEFKKWCPAFKILTYYGNIKERKLKRVGWTKANTFHICITSYKLVVQDHQSFRRKRWKYLILDEAQNIKNFKSQRWQMLLNFQTERRLLLTGTPLQNSVVELWSLMHFLMPSVFASAAHFREWFSPGGELPAGPPDAPLLHRLHQVLRPFLLRRLKRDVERQLPRKYEHVVMCRLAPRQRALYDDFMARAKTKETLASGNLLSVINVLMQLRKVCNHPDLFEPRPVTSPLALPALQLAVPALVLRAGVAARALLAARLGGDLAALEAAGAGAFAAHRARHLAPPRRLVEELTPPAPAPRAPPAALRLHLRLVPRTPPAAARAPRARAAPAPPPPPVAPAPPAPPARARLEARRRAALRRLAACNERRCWRLPLYGADLRAALAVPPVAPPPYMCTDLDSLLERMLPIIDKVCVAAGGARAAAAALAAGAGARGWRRRAAAAAAARPALSAALAALHATAARRAVAFPHPALLHYDCGKLQRLGALLRRLRAGGHRALVFTQMTRVLDVLERFLCSLGLPYLRLDGATKLDQRQVIVERFNSDARVFCMILSTRSGGVGLNLTGADAVVFYDSDWNPSMDAQAQDRAHRIGQTRDVHVYRLVTAATVEENILRTARGKRALAGAAIDRGRFTPDALRQGGIRELFGAAAPERPQPAVDGDADLARALAAAEDEADAAAAAAARAEACTDLAEFDDPPPASPPPAPQAPPPTAPDDPFAALVDQLTPVERYAMRVVESSEAAGEAERAALESMRRALTELRPRSPPAAAAPPPEPPPAAALTYCADDARAQTWSSVTAAAASMPMWCPPTPPSGDGDVYEERWARALYRRGAAAEEQLPAARAAPPPRRAPPREPPRAAAAPPSMFGGGARGRPRPRPAPPRDQPPPDWAAAEDAALRRALRLQRLPPEPPPALAPNWEWLADLVGEVARAYRSPRACRERHDALADPARRKPRRAPPARRRRDDDPRPPLARLDALRDAAERRRAAPKRRLDDAAARNPKHAALLHDHGVDYDAPPTPMEVASRRADRIAKEKQKAAAGAAAGAGGAGAGRVVVAGRRADAALLYRAPRPHLKILHHAPPAAAAAAAAVTSPMQQQQQQTTNAGNEAALRALQLQQLALRRAAPPRAPAHLVVAHLAPPAAAAPSAPAPTPAPAPNPAPAPAHNPPHTSSRQ